MKIVSFEKANVGIPTIPAVIPTTNDFPALLLFVLCLKKEADFQYISLKPLCWTTTAISDPQGYLAFSTTFNSVKDYMLGFLDFR